MMMIWLISVLNNSLKRPKTKIRPLDNVSTKTITEVDNFSELLIATNFFQGNHVTYDVAGVEVVTMTEKVEHHSKCVSSYVVETSEERYYFMIRKFIDTSDEDNIGISLYIINAKDTDEQFTYWGDGEWTPGINFNKDQEHED